MVSRRRSACCRRSCGRKSWSTTPGRCRCPTRSTRPAAAGADVIVGPLTREEVTLAADVGTRGVPLLALNFLGADAQAPAGMYQFALSPENEARDVAARLLADGPQARRRAGARGRLGRARAGRVPAGTRSAAAARCWRRPATIRPPTISAPTSHRARHRRSEARLQRLQSIVGVRLDFEPRPRADIEFIFVPAQSTSARLLRPQLRFHYAGDVGIYALPTPMRRTPANPIRTSTGSSPRDALAAPRSQHRRGARADRRRRWPGERTAQSAVCLRLRRLPARARAAGQRPRPDERARRRPDRRPARWTATDACTAS